jgi:hypothetical protein
MGVLPQSQATIESILDDLLYAQYEPVRGAISGSVTMGMTTRPGQVMLAEEESQGERVQADTRLVRQYLATPPAINCWKQ